MANKKRIIWIELLRITACFGVILLHMASNYFHGAPIDSSVWKISNFYHGISRFAVGCFIMISGAMYLDKEREWTLRKLWINYIFPIAVAYLFWQLFYAVYQTTGAGLPLFSASFMKSVIIEFSSPYFHLWYLPLQIEFLILTPVLWEVVNCRNGKKLEEYLIILFLFLHITKVSIGHFPHPYSDLLKSAMDTIQPEIVTNYVGYYILGHYLYHYQLSKKLEKLVYVMGVVCIFSGILLCQHFSMKTSYPTQSFYENYTLAAFFWSSSFFLFFKNHVSRIKWRPNTEKLICTIGKTTFGIFLIHVIFRNAFIDCGIDTLISNKFITIPILTLIIFIFSSITVYILKKVPVLGKWLL